MSRPCFRRAAAASRWLGPPIGLLLAAAPAAAETEALPRVHVMAMGGTIASRGDATAALTADELVADLPQLAQVASITTEQFANLASDRVLPSHWLRLAKRAEEVLDEGAAGVVITHGTDTLEETAYFLNLTVRRPGPVVVVGAMRRASALSPDGPANLLAATRVAAAPEAASRGVLVVLNDEIHAARDLTKGHSVARDAFRSADFGALGRVDVDRVRFHRRPERRHTADSEFDVSSLAVSDLPRVDVAFVYAGADGAAIDAFTGRRSRGIVVAGTGSGGRTTGQREALARAVEAGVVVVISSRTGAGISIAARPPLVRGDDLVPQKARILLMLALTRTSDPNEIQRIFEDY